MDSTSSTDKNPHPFVPAAPFALSPTSVTQGLSNPGSFPATESDSNSAPSKSPRMLSGHAFEVRTFTGDAEILTYSQPVIVLSDAHLSPMERLFSRIQKNDREFVQKLPLRLDEREALGIFLDKPDPVSGYTPLTFALSRGHLEVAIDLLILGAHPKRVDGNGRKPEAAFGTGSMGSMVVQFMILWNRYGKPRTLNSDEWRKYKPVLTKIDVHTGHTLTTWAVSRCHDALLERLMNTEPDFRVRNRFGRNVLEEACVSGSLSAVSRVLEAWPALASRFSRQFLIDAIRIAAEKNRPMVVAQLLSFFRTAYRQQEGDPTGEWEENVWEQARSEASADQGAGLKCQAICSGNQQLQEANLTRTRESTQEDAYRLFLGSPPEKQPTLEKIMYRTHDNFLLTEEESHLLDLKEIVVLAKKKQLKKVVEIIHAHAKLPADD